ncbi:hypothetical protein VNO78_20010 [Psophocarpus tetragonolobus]|uniref:Uncharacterized protein n=1 Tax=Psophocarpus tetragonolobus TaxID=3891 RepID=A0AAN9SCK7_PSOTE
MPHNLREEVHRLARKFDLPNKDRKNPKEYALWEKYGNGAIVVDEPEVTSDNFYGRAYLLAMPLDMAIRKMLETLDDPFTRFLEPEKFKSSRSGTRGVLTGVGLSMGYLTKTDMQASGLVISASPGGPIYRAGGSSGDGNRAIVVDEPEVTRDHFYSRAYWGEHEFIMVDTGRVITISKSQATIMEELAISTTMGMDGIPLAVKETTIARMLSIIERPATAVVEESSVIISWLMLSLTATYEDITD